MKKIFGTIAIASLLIISCKEIPKNNLKNADVCESLPGEFTVNKISNGCDINSKNILGGNSTVSLSMGCTGTVVSPHFIVTASHCLYSQKSDRFVPKESIKVVFGNNSYDVFNIKIANVKNYYTNDYYTSKSSDNPSLGDIALIETEEDLVKDMNLTPAKIAVNIPHASQLILNVGYGITGRGNSTSYGLKRWSISSLGKVDIYDNYFTFNYSSVSNYFTKQVTLGNVSNKYNTTKVEHSLLITDKISAQQGQTCNGDSGGPQFISVNGEALLLSATQGVHGFWLGKKAYDILANNEDDCNKLSTSINTRIGPYVDWLNSKMKASGEQLVIVNN